MRLDRQLQLKILEFLRNSYPQHGKYFNEQSFTNHPDFMGNVKYLVEHGLIAGSEPRAMGEKYQLLNATLTAQGLDFLEDDGGVSAILNAGSVLHAFIQRFQHDVFEASGRKSSDLGT